VLHGGESFTESVETMEQAALLRERGCDYAQGYFYSRPVSAEHCRSLLQHLDHERPLTDHGVARRQRRLRGAADFIEFGKY
jgi:predicted signal transduction protein with EAL and GGDEF domain